MRLAVIAVSLFGGIGILWLVNSWWARHRVSKAIKTAHAEGDYGQATYYSESQLAGLPAPVVRYFRRVLRDGQRCVRFATVRQESQYKMNPNADWIDVEATSTYTTDRISLVWNAMLRDSRYVWRHAQLIYLHATGEGLIKLYGGITLSEYCGSEADISLLFRFLSEALWFPTALLPGRHVEWREHGANSAEAIITDDELQASAVFYFNEAGEVERITTNDKFRDFRGAFHKEGFVMNCRNYRQINNVFIPTEFEFIWQLDSGDFPYATIRVTDVQYS